MFQLGAELLVCPIDQVPVPDFAQKSLALLIGLFGSALGMLITGYLFGLSDFLSRIDALEHLNEQYQGQIAALSKDLYDRQAVSTLTAPAKPQNTIASFSSPNDEHRETSGSVGHCVCPVPQDAS